MDLSDAGKYKKALSLFNKLAKVSPDEPQVFFERAMTLLNLERDADAQKDLEHTLRLQPDYPGAAQWLSVAQAGQGKPLLAAETALRAAREEAPVSPQSWADCAQLFVKGGQPDRAQEMLEQYFAEYESRVTTYTCYLSAPMRAYAKLLPDAEQAMRYAEKARAQPHTVPADDFVWIECLHRLGHRDEARAELERRREEYAGTVPFAAAESLLARGRGNEDVDFGDPTDGTWARSSGPGPRRAAGPERGSAQ